jgi:hypothetical protein
MCVDALRVLKNVRNVFIFHKWSEFINNKAEERKGIEIEEI